MNHFKLILLSLILLTFFVTSCKTTMSQLQEDLSGRLINYTQCPIQPVFKHPLIELDIDETHHFALQEDDFVVLEQYILQLEKCVEGRLLDIHSRNRIIQNLLK